MIKPSYRNGITNLSIQFHRIREDTILRQPCLSQYLWEWTHTPSLSWSCNNHRTAMRDSRRPVFSLVCALAHPFIYEAGYVYIQPQQPWRRILLLLAPFFQLIDQSINHVHVHAHKYIYKYYYKKKDNRHTNRRTNNLTPTRILVRSALKTDGEDGDKRGVAHSSSFPMLESIDI